MRLALLGCDDETLTLIKRVVSQEGHTLAAAFDLGEFAPEIQKLAPLVSVREDWESLLLGNLCDVLIVARGQLDSAALTGFSSDERRCDQLRKLAQAAVPMILVHPACEMIIGYEVEMIRSDSRGVMRPYVASLHHPVWDRLLETIRGESSDQIGSVEQVIWERTAPDRSRLAVITQLPRDVAIIRRLIGDIRKLSASGPAAGETRDPLAARPKSLPPLTNLSVHLSGEAPFPARWSVGPPEPFHGARLSIIGSLGKVVLLMPHEDDSPWSLQTTAKTVATTTYAPWDEMRQLLQLFSSEDAGQAHSAVSWLDACRDLEVTAAVDRSLERGRAVEFFNEQHTQEQSFKGVMAVGGCLMLMLAIGVLLIAATVEGLQLEIRHSRYWQAWPLYLLAPIVLFLLLQMLQGVARGESATTKN